MAHPLKVIDRIKFGILSPDEIRKLSVTRIITADTYDEDGLPIDSGLMDGRLGTIEPGQRCKTCGNRVGECPGHFGHIELARPVIHVGFAGKIQKILRAICRKCSRVIMLEEDIEEIQTTRDFDEMEVADSDEVLDTLKKAAKLTECPYCGAKQVKIKLEKPTTFYEKTEAGTNRLNPSEIRDRFERMTDDDCLALGINPEVARPEWMILTVLPIPPVCVRPSITLDSGVRSEDDMTHKLVDIIRINQRLRENIEAGAPQLIVEDLWELLQYHVTTYFNNEVSGIPPARHRSGRALRTLAQRLKGKEGRFRSNLSGKRVDFSARTVISPDPNLSINEVGVPFDIAKILTIPERVTEWNIQTMRDLIINGPDIHPGANYVIRLDGRRIDLRFVKNREAVADTLEPGFTVERHLKDRDIVLFNRQPSLHRLSIMAHEVIVMPFKTFRLSLCVCLSGETEVATDLGTIKISKLVENWSEYSPLSCSWNNGQNVYFSGISKPHIINPQIYNLKSYRIHTENAREIEATSEHPFYTARGIVKCGDLKKDDLLAMYPIEYPEMETIEKDDNPTILTPEQITEVMPDHTYESYTFQELERIEIINIKKGTKKEIDLASLVGHIFGDGSLLITPEGGRVIFRAAELKDIKAIWEIVQSLHLEPTSIQLVESKEFPIQSISGKKTKAKGKIYLFEIRHKPVAIAFRALGVPVGDRVTQEYRVPEWILNGSQMVKRAFLRSYFGAEMSTPRLHTSSKKKFNQPVLKIAKIEKLSVEHFINDIINLLKSFGIDAPSVTTFEGNIRKDGTKTVIYSLNFKTDDENLLFLYKYIGFEFAHNKEELARLVSEYNWSKIGAKINATIQLDEAYKLKAQGLSYSEITEKVKHKSWSTIASWISQNRKEAGLPTDFPDFPTWQKIHTTGLKNGFVWDRISRIEEIDLPLAYDITTIDTNHNFIANEFLVKNCPPYNADFDGDEMNLHVPQSEEAQAEARILMRVQEQILTPRYGGPIIGGIQDYISAAFILTRKSSLYTREQVGNLLMAAGYVDPDETKERYVIPPPAIQYPHELWTGKQIMSVLLPDGINLSLKAKLCRRCDECKGEECPNDAYVLIRNGKLLTGIIDKKAIGAGQPESVLHRIVKDYSTQKGRQFLDSVARMLIEVITHIGFTIGLDDVEIQEEADARINHILDNASDMVNKLIEVYKRGELQRLPGRTLLETLEMKIMGVLSEARDEAGRVAGEYLGIDKHIVIMTKTGARGNPLNLAQMAACVGQQSVRGERIIRGYRQRTLPHFQRGDLSAPARGFVNSSYYKGLIPIEFFFHAMGGREGLVDTAVRTSTSGYMQRRLINALQDIKIEYDGTVRNAIGDIIQYKYGEDRIDPAKSDHGKAVNIDVLVEKVISEIDFVGPAINPDDTVVISKLDELLKTDQLPQSILKKISTKLPQIEIDSDQFAALINETLKSYHRALIEPGEAVGIVAAQSIGEPGTQMSIPGDTEVIIRKAGFTEIVPIGDFVDNLMAHEGPENCFEDHGSTICDVPENYQLYVPALSTDEGIRWTPLLQVSRHPPNGDLLKIKTRSGREIISTLSHSFVIRVNNEIIPIEGSKLTLGDRIPLLTSLPIENPSQELDLELYLPKSEFWYGSELAKADESTSRLGRAWKDEFDILYTVPVGVDGLRTALKTDKTEMLLSGFVYPKMHHSEHTRIPETLELNFLTGWFIGAYLAEGTNAGYFVTITNIDERYRNRAADFADYYGINHNTKESEGVFGPSISINLNSTVLSTLLSRMCGKTANHKFIPSWALNAPDEFIRGLLRAYFDGDGSISVERSQIRAGSNSSKLRDGICLLLSRFGIYSSKYSENNQYNLRIPGKYAPIFRDLIGSDILNKAEALHRLAQIEETKESQGDITYDVIDMVPGFGELFKDIRSKLKLSNKSSLSANIRKITRKQVIGRQTLKRYINTFEAMSEEKKIDITCELSILKRALNSSVIWDEIIGLELINSPTEYVYDFSVDALETFTTAEGLITHNTLKTFHYAGAAEFNVTLGLPRLIEIVDARRNPSTPTMTVFLEKDTEDEKEMEEKAREIARMLELTKVENIAKSVDIDLATMNLVITVDQDLMNDKKIDLDQVKKQIENQLKAFKKEDIKGSKDSITLDPKTDDLDKLQKLLEKVRELPIKGLKGINRVIIREDEDTNEFIIHTDGTNFKEALLIQGVDSKRTVTNHIREIESTLGIEACRTSLIKESMNVLEEQGLDVDIRHIMLVADLMTNSGAIRQIGRHGISGQKSSVLARAAFEVTIKHLLEASIRGDEDPLRGITENVIIGQVIPLGTGGIDLLVRPPKKSS